MQSIQRREVGLLQTALSFEVVRPSVASLNSLAEILRHATPLCIMYRMASRLSVLLSGGASPVSRTISLRWNATALLSIPETHRVLRTKPECLESAFEEDRLVRSCQFG